MEGTVHFWTTGEDLTRLAREMVLSDRPEAAWRLLFEGLAQPDERARHDAAWGVLTGHKRLAGGSYEDQTLTLEAEPPAVGDPYRKRVFYVYAGRIEADGKWWRPVAWVSGDGKTPLRANERVFVDDHGCSYVFEECGPIPRWMRAKNDVRPAVREWQFWRKRGLPERRARWFPLDPSKYEDDDSDEWLRSEARRLDDLEEKRAVILERAGGDLFELKWDGGSAKVPRAPFLNWALGRSSLRRLAPPWEPVCPSGYKLPMDDPYHTDWMVGAGLDPLAKGNYGHGSLVQEAANDEMFRLQEEHSKSKCAVLSPGPDAYGPVFLPKAYGQRCPIGAVVVLPNLRPEWLESIVGAAAVVCGAGGEGAHLAQVGRERSLPIVRVEGAAEKFREGEKLSVSAERLAVQVWYH